MTELPLRFVAELDVSAASGLAVFSGSLWVVADDGAEIVQYDPRGRRLGAWPLPGAPLPLEPQARKAVKADYEALARLADGSVLTLGSGSTARRERGWVLAVGVEPRAVELGALYAEARSRLGDLNVEGVAVGGNVVLLANRRVGEAAPNALIVLDGPKVTEALAAGRLDHDALREIVTVDLGTFDGVPLGFTDLACADDGTFWALAAAEDTPNAYDDGACAGSMLFRLHSTPTWTAEPHGRVAAVKLEGLGLGNPALGEPWAYLVGDADDPTRRAPLYALDAAP